jgi:chaperonin GroEL
MSNKYKEVKIGDEARQALMKGVKAVYWPVSATMGAAGKNGAYYSFDGIRVTNDGLSIARQISPKDEFERIGADLIKQSAERTVAEAGDGSTGTVVLANALLEESFKKISEGKNPMVLRRELEEAKDEVVALIKKSAKPIKNDTELLDVAKISVEDEKTAEIVTNAVKRAGTHGAVVVEEGSGYTIETEEVQGYFWNKGYVSPYMVTNEGRQAVLVDPVIIVTDRYMNQNKDMVKILNILLGQGKTSFLIIADKIEGELLGTLVANKLKGVFTAVAVQKPGTTEELEDIATLTGAIAITKEKGIKDIELFHCGHAKKVVVKEDKTTIINDSNPSLEARVIELAVQLKNDKDNDLLKERKAKLSDGVVILRVGAKTEAEKKYLKDKVDDAVGAVRAAMEEGIVEGAGACLNKINLNIKSDGAEIFDIAVQSPFNQILANAGIEDKTKIYNVLTGKPVKDLFKEGIIDPVKVVRCIVENAVSFAKNALTITSLIVNKEELPRQYQD